MCEIARGACELLEKGDAFVLATIFDHTGSTPRGAGSRMLITAGGEGIGTIGGGLLEARVISRSTELLAKGRSEVLHFDLNWEITNSMDMICGGQADVLLSSVLPTKENRRTFDAWRRLGEEGDAGAFLIRVTGSKERIDTVAYDVVPGEDGMEETLGLSGEEERRRIADIPPGELGTVSTPEGFVLVIPEEKAGTLYLFGAGHVAVSTARVASMAGFRISVFDDRPEYASRERFPNARRISVLDRFESGFLNISPGPGDCVVILTRGHLHDRTVLAGALKTRAGYIGMIGSRRKRDAIYTALRKEGVCQTDLDRVHSPIGLAIGARTPEEIAVSIVAELIKHRSEGISQS